MAKWFSIRGSSIRILCGQPAQTILPSAFTSRAMPARMSPLRELRYSQCIRIRLVEQLSADYEYYLEQTLRNHFGGNFISAFGAGTCGT